MKNGKNAHDFSPAQFLTVEVRDYTRGLTDIAYYESSGPYSYRDVNTKDPVHFYVGEWRYTNESQQQILMSMLKHGDKFEIGVIFRRLDINKSMT